MKLKYAVLAAACVFITGCGPEGEAKDAVRQLLNDPDSAQFSDLRKGKSEGDICGLVNAKNRMGGFVGKTPFFYRKLTQTAAIVEVPQEREFRSLWSVIQLGSLSDEISTLSQQCRLVDQWADVCGFEHPSGGQPLCSMMQKSGIAIYEELKQKYGRY